MDSMFGLQQTNKSHDSMWIVIDRLIKTTHFIPVYITYTLEKLAELFVEEIVKLHRVPKSIVSHSDN